MKFHYRIEDLEELKKKDRRMAAVIQSIGKIEPPLFPDLFKTLVYAQLARQGAACLSAPAFDSLQKAGITIDPETVIGITVSQLKTIGLTARQAHALHRLAGFAIEEEIKTQVLHNKTDDEVLKKLLVLPGIGPWKAEWLMVLSLNRMNVFCIHDQQVIQGLKQVYHHRQITRSLLHKYQRYFAPQGSLASFYLWKAAAEGSQQHWI